MCVMNFTFSSLSWISLSVSRESNRSTPSSFMTLIIFQSLYLSLCCYYLTSLSLISLSLSRTHARTHARTRRDTCSLFFFFLICSDNSEVNVRSDLFLSHRNSLSYFIFPSLDFLLSLFASQPCILFFFSIFIYLSLQHTHTHTHLFANSLSPLTSKKVCLILFRSLIVKSYWNLKSEFIYDIK